MTLAMRHHWTPAQVEAMDPAFVNELMLAETAQQDHELFSADSKDNPELKKAQAKLRAELMKWRRG